MDIYNEEFVANLFNRMSKTYGLINYVSSFGFTERWRRQCVQEIKWSDKISRGYDLMSGMGESWNLINAQSKCPHRLIDIDLSEEMNKFASQKLYDYQNLKIEIQPQNVLKYDIEDSSANYIISTFGLKTFSSTQLKHLA